MSRSTACPALSVVVSGVLDRVAAELSLATVPRDMGAVPPMLFGIIECGVRPRDQ